MLYLLVLGMEPKALVQARQVLYHQVSPLV